MRGQLERGVIDVGPRLADDFKKFGHKAETVCHGVEEGFDVNGRMNLTWSEHGEAWNSNFDTLNTPHSTIL